MSRDPHRILLWIAGAILFAGTAVVLTVHSAGKPLIHDEHQFVAPGALLAHEGLLPYLHYPYFHVPYMAFVYGAIFLVTDHLLLGARLFSVACGAGAVVLLFAVAAAAFPRRKLLLGAAAAALLLFNPLFEYTTGYAWNHDAPVLLALAAMLLHCRGMRRGSVRDVVASGALVALATGMRLSFAPLAAPFAALPFLLPDERPRRRLIVGFVAGAAVASLPMLVLALLEPKAFLFGNFEYPRLNTAVYAEHGITRAMTLSGKLGYFVEEIVPRPGTLVVVLLFAAALLRGGWIRDRGERWAMEAFFVVVLLPFLTIGVLAATPAQHQYFYTWIPFLLLAAVTAMAATGSRTGPRLLVVCAVVAVVFGRATYDLDGLGDTASWHPMRVHEVGERIAELAPAEDGRVYTLRPTVVLEGGARAYPCFAVGPFAWRTGHLLTAERRAELGIVTQAELGALLTADPPGAILTGPEAGMATDLNRYVKTHGLQPHPLPDDDILFAPRRPR